MESLESSSAGFSRPVIIAISLLAVFIGGIYIATSSNRIIIYQSLCKSGLISPNNTNTNRSEVNYFLNISLTYKTDKVGTHHYEILYEKYLRKYMRSNVILLEIGLGCGMSYGPGASAHVWRDYFGPTADIYFLEYNRACGEAWYRSEGHKLNVRMFYGSQDNLSVLKYVNWTPGYFDVIIDDGGHTMQQQITSFVNLISKVRPGGIYVIEDLLTSYMADYGGGYLRNTTTIEFIKSLVDNVQRISPQKTIQVANRIRSFEIADEICFFTVK